MEVCNVSDAAHVPVVIEEVAPENWGTEVKPEVEAKRDKLYALKA
jgi:phenylpyruvate tautomerase PptA (4-oxalocrotonate tautomerase family)